MNLLRNPFLNSTPSVMDEVKIEEQRTEQAWRYAGVACLIFVFMSGVLWLFNYRIGAIVCTAQTFVLLILMGFFGRKKELKKRRLFTNMFLGFSCSAVFLVSVSHPSISVALFFLPISILMAAQVLGVRGAIPWLTVNIVAFVAFKLMTHTSGTPWTSAEIETLALSLGVVIATFLSCHQSEQLFRKRTANLVELSAGFQRLATTDFLTGLMNRHQFQNQLEANHQNAKQESSRFALLMIDMDGFKEINDSQGHLTGDDTLREIAARLADVAGFDSVFRIGGDEFCVIISELDEPSKANDLAVRIHQSLCERYFIADTEFRLGASVGTAIYPEHGKTPSDLLAYADAAMYHAKENSLGVCDHDAQSQQQVAKKYLTPPGSTASNCETNGATTR